ncbi:unnamed protein product [Chrysodeixis includens]|uniref:Uncharacterized protein n=1 Tax=Chrysodeixis includens TaxID=689277 RepID=A0A9N8Q235_CHRIL|nr:unnamed protein product [Chrysodeixis includens]
MGVPAVDCCSTVPLSGTASGQETLPQLMLPFMTIVLEVDSWAPNMLSTSDNDALSNEQPSSSSSSDRKPSEKYWYSFSKDSINTQNIAANMLLHKDVMMKQK